MVLGEETKWGRENPRPISDKPDRHTGRTCFHVEVPITGRTAYEGLAFTAHIGLAFDLREFFEPKLCFKEIDLIAFAEVFPDKPMRDDDASKLKRGERLVERAMKEANDTCRSAQAVDCSMKKHLNHLDSRKRKRHIDRVLKRMDNRTSCHCAIRSDEGQICNQHCKMFRCKTLKYPVIPAKEGTFTPVSEGEGESVVEEIASQG